MANVGLTLHVTHEEMETIHDALDRVRYDDRTNRETVEKIEAILDAFPRFER